MFQSFFSFFSFKKLKIKFQFSYFFRASQLTPSTNSQSNTVEPTTITGKRTKSRGNSIGASPVTSPQHSSETSPILTQNNSKISTNNFNSTGKNKKGVSTVLCNHVNFSANFFSNVSVGYDILLQTFQLLNVQVNIFLFIFNLKKKMIKNYFGSVFD